MSDEEQPQIVVPDFKGAGGSPAAGTPEAPAVTPEGVATQHVADPTGPRCHFSWSFMQGMTNLQQPVLQAIAAPCIADKCMQWDAGRQTCVIRAAALAQTAAYEAQAQYWQAKRAVVAQMAAGGPVGDPEIERQVEEADAAGDTSGNVDA